MRQFIFLFFQCALQQFLHASVEAGTILDIHRSTSQNSSCFREPAADCKIMTQDKMITEETEP